jgi:hypothetical protein
MERHKTDIDIEQCNRNGDWLVEGIYIIETKVIIK